MAFPTILVDSTDGAASDTACSGAGPTTALTGTGDGEWTTTSNFQVPNQAFTGVDTTGLHCLYVTDTATQTSSFHRITAVNNASTATASVTVSPATGVAEAGLNWAIGGVRATLNSTQSELLIDNGGAAGDARPGWTIEFQSGHTETGTTAYDFRRAGDTTDGPITIRGASGAATMPVFTITANANIFVLRASHIHIKDLALTHNSATDGTNGAVVPANNYVGNVVSGLAIDGGAGSGKLDHGVLTRSAVQVFNCEIKNCDNGVISSTSWFGVGVSGCYIHDCDDYGIDVGATTSFSHNAGYIANNIIADCNIGIAVDNARVDGISSGLFIGGNTVYSCTSHGIYMLTPADTEGLNCLIANNLLHSNGGAGIEFENTEVYTWASGAIVYNNGFKSNTGGEVTFSGSAGTIVAVDSVSDGDVDNASFGTSGDFSLGSASDFKAAGIPGDFPGGLSTGYLDIGAVQRQEPAGGSNSGARNPLAGPVG